VLHTNPITLADYTAPSHHLWCLQAHEQSLSVVYGYYEPIGKRARVASGGDDQKLVVHDPESGDCVSTISGLTAHLRIMGSHATPDGQRQLLVAGSDLGTLLICDPEAGVILHTLEAHTLAVTCLALFLPTSAPDRVYFVSGYDVSQSCVRSCKEEAVSMIMMILVVMTMIRLTTRISSARFWPSSVMMPRMTRSILVNMCGRSQDCRAKVWDDEGYLIVDLGDHNGPVLGVATYQDPVEGQDRIVVGCRHRDITVWTATGTLLRSLAVGDTGSGSFAVSVFPSVDGESRLVSSNMHSGIDVWDPERGTLLGRTILSDAPVARLRCFESEDGRMLVAAICRKGQVNVWLLGDAPPSSGGVRVANKLG
jgi:WD40 repeat protein